MNESKKKIAVLNSGLGNLNSLTKCINNLGFNYVLINNPEEKVSYDKIIFPGVGSYSEAMKVIVNNKWNNFLNKNIIQEKKKFLGICIGMQILSTYGMENTKTNGLNLIDGKVISLNELGCKLKIPHIGWNDVNIKKKNALFEDIKNYSDFYFDHSFVFVTKNRKMVSSTSDYGTNFTASINSYNIYGTQFHPEKSAENGKKLLFNFLNL